MAEGGGDKMDDDDYTRVMNTRKYKNKHKNDGSDDDKQIKRNKQNGDGNQKIDKYLATRVFNTDDINNHGDQEEEVKIPNPPNQNSQTHSTPSNTLTQNGQTQNQGNTQTPNQETPQTQSTLGNTQNPHTTESVNSTTGTIHKSNKYTYRQNKDATDGKYDDQWIKNPHYTTFIIEKETKENEAKDKEKPIKYPHPMEVAKMLKNIGVTKYNNMKSVGRGRFQISFDKPRDAEQMLNSEILKKDFGFSIFVPMRFKQSIGVVRDVPPSITEQEVKENIVCSNNIKVSNVERIKKKVGVDK